MKACVEQLKTNGYAIIRGFLSPAAMALISAEVDRIYAQGLNTMQLIAITTSCSKYSTTRKPADGLSCRPIGLPGSAL